MNRLEMTPEGCSEAQAILAKEWGFGVVEFVRNHSGYEVVAAANHIIEEQNMSKLHVLSAFQIRQTVDVVNDLVALNDPSDYLKREAMEVLESLRDSETISSEDYLKLNKENENENPK